MELRIVFTESMVNDDCKSLSAKSFVPVEKLLKFDHPNIVQLHEAFTTYAFDDNSLCLVYDYHPDSIACDTESMLKTATMFTDQQIWTFITQIFSAISAIHKIGLTVDILNLGSIIQTSPNRYRLAWAGLSYILIDSLNYQSKIENDFYNFGIVILRLLLKNANVEKNIKASISALTERYSNSLVNLVSQLVLEKNYNVDTILASHASILLNQFDSINRQLDNMENNMMNELSNGRISRLLCKLNFIINRPELRNDFRWSETGDRYMLSLFYSYVFHQVSDKGEPILDMAHVISNINKLDAGSNEHVLLISKDEKSCLIVSYKSIQTSLELAYKELLK
ncbi:hypothetical protein BB561_000143 [Smittium simulii]|uniref:Pan3 C-terminal knob domain-containing protein n=1 Tax=Smittium simulii TaxID=133385 RepID=A0A2T9Z0E2_9FUNG|nr:hypothetical protein BB561_000143 [Smittium simulii]